MTLDHDGILIYMCFILFVYSQVNWTYINYIHAGASSILYYVYMYSDHSFFFLDLERIAEQQLRMKR